jgi:hypothetical protein
MSRAILGHPEPFTHVSISGFPTDSQAGASAPIDPVVRIGRLILQPPSTSREPCKNTRPRERLVKVLVGCAPIVQLWRPSRVDACEPDENHNAPSYCPSMGCGTRSKREIRTSVRDLGSYDGLAKLPVS